MNALIALLAKERQNLSINSYHEKVCFLNLFIAERGYKIILQPLQKLVIYGRIVNYSLSPTKDFNNAMHQVLNHRRKKNYDKEMNFGTNTCTPTLSEYEWKKMGKKSLTNTMNITCI